MGNWRWAGWKLAEADGSLHKCREYEQLHREEKNEQPTKEPLPKFWLNGKLTDGRKTKHAKSEWGICQHCMSEMVEWKQDEDGEWQLYEQDSNELHKCVGLHAAL